MDRVAGAEPVSAPASAPSVTAHPTANRRRTAAAAAAAAAADGTVAPAPGPDPTRSARPIAVIRQRPDTTLRPMRMILTTGRTSLIAIYFFNYIFYFYGFFLI